LGWFKGINPHYLCNISVSAITTGKLSVSHNATLTLMPDHWLIHYVDDTEELQSVKWKLDKYHYRSEFYNAVIFFDMAIFRSRPLNVKKKLLPAGFKGKISVEGFF
jgi:hypothetical protein